jgi:hypothetical protein
MQGAEAQQNLRRRLSGYLLRRTKRLIADQVRSLALGPAALAASAKMALKSAHFCC